MLRNNLKYLVVFVIGVIAGAYCVLFCINLVSDVTNFFSMQLKDIAQIAVQLFIAIAVVCFVQRATANDTRKREILLQLLGQFEERLSEALSMWNTYCALPNKSSFDRLMYRLKRTSGILNLLATVAEAKGPKPLTQCAKDTVLLFWDMKKGWTENLYPEITAQLSSGYIENGLASYHRVQQHILACKMSLCE